MPIALGLHLAVAIFFAVHAVRTGQQNYWLFILLSFPGLGSLIYFLTIYLPSSRLRGDATKLARAAVKSMNPTRELREAQAAYEYAPTAQNQIRLAQALLDAGESEQALSYFEQCLQGVFSEDLEIRWSTAQAAFQAGRADVALSHLMQIRAQDRRFRSEAVALLVARSYALQGDTAQARAEFDSAVRQSGSFDSKAEYALWLAGQKDWQAATALHQELQDTIRHWKRPQREYHRDLIRRLKMAFANR